MLTIIIRREFLSNILTFRFAIGLIIYLALMVVCTYISTEDYKERLEGYNSAVQQHREMLDKQVEVYSQLVSTWDIGGIRVDARPTPLSVFNRGIIDKVNNTLNFGFALAPNIDTGQRQSNINPLMKAFSFIDITLVLQIVMSLLAILFAYDSISGERENGTLALTMSNSISRSVLLLGKYIGGMLTLLAIFLPSFLVSLMMIYFSPNIELGGDEWLKIGMFFLTSIAYTSAFFLIGMFLSTMIEYSATTLMIALLAWIFAVILYPNMVVFAVDQIISESVPGLNINTSTWEYWEEYEAEKDKYLDSLGLKKPKDSWERGFRIIEGLGSSEGGGVGRVYTILRGQVYPESNVPAVCKRFEYLEPLRVQYADRIWREVDSKKYQRKVSRERLATNLLRVSPAGTYYNSTAIISGTDAGSYENFFKQVQQYRQEVLQYAYDKKLFSSPGWFIVERKESLSDFPVFRRQFETAKESFHRTAVDIMILIAFNAVFFMASYISFLRSELR